MTSIETPINQSNIRSGIWHCPDTGEYCFSHNAKQYAQSKQPHSYPWHRLSSSAGEWRERMIKEDEIKRGIHIKKYRNCNTCPMKVSTETSDCEQLMHDHIEDFMGEHSFGNEVVVKAQTGFICNQCGSGAGTKLGSERHQEATGHKSATQVSLVTPFR